MNKPVAHTRIRIVVGVDDDYRIRESLASLLESAGFDPMLFASAEEFLNSGVLPRVGCLITDIRMTGMDGLELQRLLRQQRPALPVIFITAHSNSDIRRRALADGAMAFLYKPFDAATLLEFIERALTGSTNA